MANASDEQIEQKIVKAKGKMNVIHLRLSKSNLKCHWRKQLYKIIIEKNMGKTWRVELYEY